jgi:hypothetical protein
MPHQDLDGAQIGARLEQMGGKAVAPMLFSRWAPLSRFPDYVEQQVNSSLEPTSVWVLIDCTGLTARHRPYNATGSSEMPKAYHQV